MPRPSPQVKETLAVLWAQPWPLLLLDAQCRIADANPVFEQLSGRDLRQLIGQDPLMLQAAADRASDRLAREDWLREGAAAVLALGERRLVGSDGRELWVRCQLSQVSGVSGRWLLASYEDCGAEHGARLQAERSARELSQWFDLGHAGMVVYDATGLLLRSNRPFERLVGSVPVTLEDASPDLQRLLAWRDGSPLARLAAGAPALEVQCMVDTPDGRRHLGARVAALPGEAGPPRFLASVVDRSVEEERDIAQLERGVLMDAAGVGVATFDSAHGWVKPTPGASRSAAGGAGAGLQGIGRDLIEPASLPEYERLQRALRSGERAEVRYAVRHPELGPRWLLTRVSPGVLAAGRRSMSVVTLDVTEQEQARLRNEALLRELGTILEGSPAGIAYMRGLMLVRCNRGFERMLGLAPGAGAETTLEAVLQHDATTQAVAREAAEAARSGADYEGQIVIEREGKPRWFTLSVRPAQSGSGETEAVAVLSEVTRLKLQQSELEALLHDRELMFNMAEVGIVYQLGARIERANPAMAGMTGYSVPELTALDAAELFENARACVEFEHRLNAALKLNGRFIGERRLRRRDGSLRWVQVGARQVDAALAGQRVICSYVDVDELHRVRDTLVRQAERTRAVLDSVLVGIVTVAEGGIEWMNRSARRMFAGELADFVGEPISIVATPEADHPLRRTDYVQRLSEGQAESFECRLRARDGREFWVVGNAVLSARESQASQLTFALLDIERRRQAENEIAQARTSLQQVIDTAPLAIALLDARSHQVRQRNQAASAFLEPAPRGLDAALASLAPGASEVYEFELRQAIEGVEAAEIDRVWDARMVTLPASAGAPAQLLIVASDVTERREADQARLQAAIAQREVLVKEVHHRIKNNLQGVAGLLQQHAQRHPDTAATLGEAVGQVRAIAQVYGLQVGASGLLRLQSVLEAIALSVQRTFGCPIEVLTPTARAAGFVLPEAESIPIALAVNELLTNAVKHGTGALECQVAGEEAEATLCIRQPGMLAPSFSLDRYPGGVSGLGLVRALLPRRSAALSLTAQDGAVLTEVRLRPPSVLRDDPIKVGDNVAQEASG